ncbi:hypothetical protein E2C01_045253 [Portunus trituberculatus]|uniref:Uncharacterized protein n=1 Tax=Portunus trituberculatus TaxID=210409 RepID=A0A5B7G1K9_PORTR|nr:hypothetical protein [Portunus trituberculatus]
MIASQVQEALLAKGTRGGSLGHEPSSVHSGECVVMADAPLFTKQPQAEVGRSMKIASLLITSARDPEVAISEVLGLLANLRPLGVGLLVVIHSVKCIQPLSPREMGYERQHHITPLLHPQHPKGGIGMW